LAATAASDRFSIARCRASIVSATLFITAVVLVTSGYVVEIFVGIDSFIVYGSGGCCKGLVSVSPARSCSRIRSMVGTVANPLPTIIRGVPGCVIGREFGLLVLREYVGT